MNFQTQRVPSPSCFIALQSAAPGDFFNAFGMQLLKLSYDAMPIDYADDLLLRVPDFWDTPQRYGLAMSSGGQECFLIVHLVSAQGERGGIAVPLSHFALLMAPTGLVTSSGRVIAMSPHEKVLLPDDGKPLAYEVIDVQSKQYFVLRESPALKLPAAWPVNPPVPLNPAHPTPSNPAQALSPMSQHILNLAFAGSPVSGADIVVEVGSPCFGRVHGNANPGLMHLAGL
jgi:hypothetical protein